MLGAARPSFALPTPAELSEYDAAFEATRDAPDALSGARAKDTWLMEYGLAPATLGAVWQLADVTRNGKLDRFEHRLAMHLIQKVCCAGGELPAALPPAMLVASSDDAASRVRAVAEAVSLLPAGGEGRRAAAAVAARRVGAPARRPRALPEDVCERRRRRPRPRHAGRESTLALQPAAGDAAADLEARRRDGAPRLARPPRVRHRRPHDHAPPQAQAATPRRAPDRAEDRRRPACGSPAAIAAAAAAAAAAAPEPAAPLLAAPPPAAPAPPAALGASLADAVAAAATAALPSTPTPAPTPAAAPEPAMPPPAAAAPLSPMPAAAGLPADPFGLRASGGAAAALPASAAAPPAGAAAAAPSTKRSGG